MSAEGYRRYRFGQFAFDSKKQAVTGLHGRDVPMAPKPLALLRYLILHRERVVQREELLSVVWPNSVVSDASLSTAVKELRKGLEEHDADAGRFIQTFARRGYRFVGEVVEELSVADANDSVEPEPVSGNPLTGRGEDLQVLAMQRRDLKRSIGTAIFIVGEAGIGKTALLDAHATCARGESIHVIQANCETIPGSPALWPFVQIVRQLESSNPLAHELVGSLCGLQSEVESPSTRLPQRHAAERRFQCFDAVMRVIASSCTSRPMLILIEDLQWADPSSLELMRWMVPRLRRLPVALATTARSGLKPLNALYEACERIQLGRLGPRESSALVRTAQPDLSDEVVEWVVAAGGGHPLQLHELARTAARHAAHGNLTKESFDACIEDMLTRLSMQRLSSLSAPCRELLELCACLGPIFDPRALRDITRIPHETLLVLLHDAVTAGLLLETDAASGRYRFEHEGSVGAIAGSLPRSEKALWHSKIAAYIATAHRGAAVPNLDRWQQTVAGAPEPEPTLRPQTATSPAEPRSGDETWGSHASTVPFHSALVIDNASRVELIMQHAQSRSRAPGGASPEELQGSYLRAFALAKDVGCPTLLARAALGYSGCELFRGATFSAFPSSREEIGLLRKADSAQREGTVWHVLVQARLGVALSSTDRVAEGQRLTQRAVREATTLGDPRTLCEALLQRCRSLSGPGQANVRSRIAGEAVAIAEQAGLLDLVNDAKFEVARARLHAGDMTHLDLRTLAAQDGHADDPFQGFRGAYWQMLRLLLEGNVDRAEQQLEGLYLRARTVNPIAAARLFPAFETEIDRLRGRRSALGRLDRIEPTKFHPAVWMGFYWLFALLDAGHRKRARVAYEVLLRNLDSLARNQYFLPSVGVAVWAAYRFSDTAGARRLHEKLLPYDGELITGADGLLVFGPVSHYLSSAAMVMGDLELARAHARRATQQSEQLNAAVPQLLTRQLLSQLLYNEGKHDEARREFSAVAEEMRRRRLEGLIDELEFAAASTPLSIA